MSDRLGYTLWAAPVSLLLRSLREEGQAGGPANVWRPLDLQRVLTPTRLVLTFDPPRREVKQGGLVAIFSFGRWGN